MRQTARSTPRVEAFDLSAEAGAGSFRRQPSAFRDWVVPETDARFPAQKGRYHLYVSTACPWSHRALIVRKLKRLEDVVDVSYVHPFRDARGWAFDDASYRDHVNGCAFLAELYEVSRPGFAGRISVPVLWDRHEGRIVNNESADVVRMFNSAFDAWGDRTVDLYPASHREEIDALNAWIYTDINDGVYRAGFARTQASYDEAFHRLFRGLDRLERMLASRRFLTGDALTEADWRLWVTLLRFDRVYHTHFRCNGARITDYAELWDYTRALHQRPGIVDTFSWPDILTHYYTTHDELNPKRLVPGGPLSLDFSVPSSRS